MKQTNWKWGANKYFASCLLPNQLQDTKVLFSGFHFGTENLEAHKENNSLDVAEFSQHNENHVTKKCYLTFHGRETIVLMLNRDLL